MEKLKKEWVITGICIIFILSTIALYAQKGALIAKQENLQAKVDNLLTGENRLKRLSAEASAKLSAQAKLIASLKNRLQILNNDKQAIIEQIEALKEQVVVVPPEIPEIPNIE